MRIPGHSDRCVAIHINHPVILLYFSVYCLEFDSQRIVTGSRDRTIKVWSLRTGRLLGTFWGAHQGSVLCLKFEHDWDQNRDGVTEMGPDSAIEQISASGDLLSSEKPLRERFPTTTRTTKRRGFMVSGSSDCSICVWDIWTGRPIMEDGMETSDKEVNAEVRDILKGHVGGVLDLKIDKKWIVSW